MKHHQSDEGNDLAQFVYCTEKNINNNRYISFLLALNVELMISCCYDKESLNVNRGS